MTAKSNEDAERGERIRLVRTALGFETKSDFARRLGIGISRYHQWESGRIPPNEEGIRKFCEVTGATRDYVMAGGTAGLPLSLSVLLARENSP